MSVLGAGFVRVSSGSQDETSQLKILAEEAAQRDITIVKWFRLHGYSASRGAQEPALREVIADMERDAYSVLLVTESSRLDRRDDLDAQAEILLGIRSAGGDVISVAEPQFGKTDFAGRIVTLVAQHANAEKSRMVRQTTYRGTLMVIANKACRGPLPLFWELRGERYAKQASCVDPESVRDIYVRVAARESLLSIGRRYNVTSAQVKKLVRFPANHTGVVECRYTHEGVTEEWAHQTVPVIESPLWWRANNVLAENMTTSRVNRGGRPIGSVDNWLSGILACPSCGGKTYVQSGPTASGNPRVPRLRCGGQKQERKACGIFTGCASAPIVNLVDSMLSHDATPILAFQRVAGNSHERDDMQSEVAKIQGRLSVTDDDDMLDELIATRKSLKAAIDGFILVPDVYDYAETGQTVGQMWKAADAKAKQGILRAIRDSWGLALSKDGGRWGITIGTGFTSADDANDIVDLGNGLCFRRQGTLSAR
ncbi:recombinase family protein [Frankia sp. AgB1.9]|uniref:recombinase family protein n=1 Tax=unclassified Frankia TaxID=2632575 RepID=UPI0019330816|nr:MULTISPECIES: recombinase family protein [unclassified Frankia]MBL7493608.1 recombinase family protein [Frankia sp. AgW1.1]MBL7551383.1 recombinase family protein [Frankia sp. AgB1.9]MBL7618958.1 recombinase family protein [Frankia sp. AgB1.8]